MAIVVRRNGAHTGTSLTALANQKMAQQMQGIDKMQQMQSQIHPEIYIYYNSINLLVGRRGSGKTYNVIREIMKICMLDHNGGCTCFVIISDKPNDQTIIELTDLFKDKLRIIVTDYEHAYEVLDEIMEGKTTYYQVVRKDLEGEITEESKKEILIRAVDSDFYDQLPHTLVLFEDAMNIFDQKKYQNLYKIVFKNRYQRITIFINVQEIYSIPPTIRKNLDTLWIFCGMNSKQAFSVLLNHAFPMQLRRKTPSGKIIKK
jgi:hypothetical protein